MKNFDPTDDGKVECPGCRQRRRQTAIVPEMIGTPPEYIHPDRAKVDIPPSVLRGMTYGAKYCFVCGDYYAATADDVVLIDVS